MSSEAPNKIEGFTVAFQPEIIRSNQKDEEYQNYAFQKLTQGLEIFIPHVISYRTITKYKSHLKLIASMLYFGSTVLSNVKTLGEEFAGIVQINKDDFIDHGILTSKRRRLLFFVSTTVFQFLFRKQVEQPYNSLREKAMASPESYPKLIHSLVRNLPNFNGVVDKFFKFNLTIFFIEGFYLQLSKRLQKIQYAFTKTAPTHNINYTKVGKLVMIQLILEFARLLYNVYQDQKYVKKLMKEKEEEEYMQHHEQSYNRHGKNNPKEYKKNNDIHNTDIASSDQENDVEGALCGICFDKRTNTTATPCGHLFCWDCVMQYVNMKTECPQCRQDCKPQKLVQLRNFQ